MNVFTVMLFLIIFLATLPHLRCLRSKKDKWVFAIFFAATFVLCMLRVDTVPLPSPIMAIDSLLRAAGIYYRP